MIRDLYRTLAEASEKKPKSKAKDAAKKPIPKEEPAYVIKLVDGKKTRDTIAVDFIGGGHELAYPGIIPKGEIWIEQDLSPDEQVDILVHELIELALMRRGHEYAPSHKLANELEKVFRGFEGRWKTKQAPSGDKKVEEAVLLESYNRALPAFIKYLNGGVDPYDFSHMLAEFFEDEGIDPPESFDESEPYEYLDTPDFNEHKDQFIGWLGKKLSEDMSGADAYAPTYLFMSGAKLVPRQTWLIHFSDDAGDIAENGFEFGASDFTALGLTTHLPDNKRREGPGWNFAFKADDRDVRSASKKYGEEAVLFQSAGAEAYHSGDNEQQVVFWGPNVKERYYLQQRDGDWVVLDPTTDKELVRHQNIFNVIAWVKQNHGQYKKIITNNRKAEPIQPTPVADREKLQAQKPEHTPQPFEAEETPGTCPKCGLAKHRSIPHLCPKGRSKWGMKGGKFTTPERKLYKVKVDEALSPNLKTWLDKTKVVDKSGNPLLVYHGTAIPKTKFRDDRGGGMGGIYFTPDLQEAARLAENDVVDGDDKPCVIAAYIRITNPVPNVHWETRQQFSLEQKAQWVKEGYDGIIDDSEIVAFFAKQVKIVSPNVYKQANKTIKESEGGNSLLVIVKNAASNEHPDDHVPEDYTWAREKAFNPQSLIHMMPGGLAGWKSWLKDECRMVPGQWDKLAKTDKIEDPVVVSPGHIWDGWHRIAAAIVNGIKTIPAIVGKHRAR